MIKVLLHVCFRHHDGVGDGKTGHTKLRTFAVVTVHFSARKALAWSIQTGALHDLPSPHYARIKYPTVVSSCIVDGSLVAPERTTSLSRSLRCAAIATHKFTRKRQNSELLLHVVIIERVVLT